LAKKLKASQKQKPFLSKSTLKKLKAIAITLVLIAGLLYFHKTVIRYSFQAYRYLQSVHQKRNLTNTVFFPDTYSIHGIDISRYQPDVDWTTLKAINVDKDTVAFQFVFIKATEGIFWEDPTFDDNWDDALKNNVARGAYHYFKPNSNALLQAKNFISSVKLKKGDLPPVLDIEEAGKKNKKELVNALKIYITTIEKKYGVKPIIYSNINFIENYLADDFKNYKFWVAHYYVKDLKISDEIDWVFWQYHDKAHLINSASGYDVNVFNGNKNDFNKLLIR
jgi:lysozyme